MPAARSASPAEPGGEDWQPHLTDRCGPHHPRAYTHEDRTNFMKLVVVESPAKAKTIEKYLGSEYRVLASYGHVRDLPPKDGSVDPDNGFAMEWENYADKARQLKAIT